MVILMVFKNIIDIKIAVIIITKIILVTIIIINSK